MSTSNARIENMASVTLSFINKWSPKDRVPEFTRDLERLTALWLMNDQDALTEKLLALSLTSARPNQKPEKLPSEQ